MKQVNLNRYTSITQGQSVTLTASWPGQYGWNEGQTGRSITVSPPRSATYTVSDPQSCLADVFTVDVAIPTNVAEQFDGKMVIYPNPTTERALMHVEIPNPRDISVYLTDSRGVILFGKQYTNATLVEELVLLPTPGMYVFWVKIGDQTFSRMSFRQ
jgi:hypothetical protein